jgi:NADH pyrophosphatase NudC (nudix superfamily)
MSDPIEREDAIREMALMLEDISADLCEDILTRFGYDTPQELATEAMSVIPSADRPQGEWVDAEIPLESGDTMPIQVCNLCKTFYPLAYTGGGHRFCPNCGAKMKGADDD